MRKYLLPAAIAVTMNMFGQLPGDLHITGEIQHDSSTDVTQLWVELHNTQQPEALQRAPVMYDGNFEFHNVPSGNYELRLLSRYGDPIRSEYVSLNRGQQSVMFRLQTATRKPPAGAVSVSQLQHQVNRKAIREYRLGVRSAAKGDAVAAMRQLRSSVDADPEFVAAHHQLGVALVSQGELEQALAEFRKSVALDPALAIGYSNLAIVLLKLQRFAEAEKESRRALQLEPDMVKAHYILAFSLLYQRKDSKEALNHLRLTYGEFPQARAMGSQIEQFLKHSD